MNSLLTAYWIKIAATLALLIAFLVLFLRGNNKPSKGPKSNSLLQDKIAKLGEDYTLLSGVVVPALRGMSRIDHVILSPYGIFVLTVIDVPGKVSGKARNSEWEIKRGRQREILYNPLWENRKWVNALENHLGPQPFIPVVTFTRAGLKSDFGKNVIPLARLAGFIKQFDQLRLSPDRLQEILQKLKLPQPENQ